MTSNEIWQLGKQSSVKFGQQMHGVDLSGMKSPIRGVPPLVKVLDLQVFAQGGSAEHVLYDESRF